MNNQLNNPLTKGLNATLVVSIAGLLFGIILNTYTAENSPGSAWRYFFQRQDPLWLFFMVILTATLKWIYNSNLDDSTINLEINNHILKNATLYTAFFVFTFTLIGSDVVYHNFALSLDEFLALFQAKIFSNGNIAGPIDPEWKDWLSALQPIWVLWDNHKSQWIVDYFPINSVLHSIYLPFTNTNIISPIMAGFSIIILGKIINQQYKKEITAPMIGIALLSLSPQFLITAMSPYAMTTHLFLNLVWLFFFLKEKRIYTYIGALIGFLAIGIHQLHNFLTFSIPFLVLLSIKKDWPALIIHSITYITSLIFWVFWKDFSLSSLIIENSQDSFNTLAIKSYWQSMLAFLHSHSLKDLIGWSVNLFRFIAWQHILLLPLIISAWYFRKNMTALTKTLVWSCVISIIPYIILMPTQGHGWGYRYLHGLLGNISLIATFGWVQLKNHSQIKNRNINLVFITSCIFMIILALPLRNWQTEKEIAPYANSMQFLQNQSVDILLIDGNTIWYGQDLVRNDPTLTNTPKIMLLQSLNNEKLKTLCEKYTVKLITLKDLIKFGIKPNAGINTIKLEIALEKLINSHNCYNN